MIVTESGTDISVAHHHVEPHLRHLPAAQPGEAPGGGGRAPPEGEIVHFIRLLQKVPSEGS